MKVLMVSKHVAGALPGDFYYPGEWVDAFQFSLGLRAAGAEVVILTPEIHPDHRYRYEGEFGGVLKRNGIPHRFAPTRLQTGEHGGSFRLRMFRGERRALQAEQPDIVVYLGLGPSLLAGLRNRPPLVPFICWGPAQYEGRERDNDAKANWSNPAPRLARWEDWLFRRLVSRRGAPTSEDLLRKSDAIALLHPRGYRALKANPEFSSKTFLAVKGVDLRAADAAPPGPEPVDVLFLGGIFHRKGVFHLLDAFTRVNREIPRASLGIAGSGPPRLMEELRGRIEDLGINARYFGGVSFHDRWGYLKSARIFAFPSLKDDYNSSLLEAMACRLPVVTTRDVDSPVEDGATGFIIAPGDVDALAERILWLLRHEQDRARMGGLARTKVRDWREVARQVMDELFAPLISERE